MKLLLIQKKQQIFRDRGQSVSSILHGRFLLRSEGREHRQPKILLYFNYKAFLTSGKQRMEMEVIQQDPHEFSCCLNNGLSAVPFISNSINLKASVLIQMSQK